MQIVIKCEQRVTALQQEHLAEMSKRDMLLQRAKDAIIRLEAQLAGMQASISNMQRGVHSYALQSALTRAASITPGA